MRGNRENHGPRQASVFLPNYIGCAAGGSDTGECTGAAEDLVERADGEL